MGCKRASRLVHPTLNPYLRQRAGQGIYKTGSEEALGLFDVGTGERAELHSQSTSARVKKESALPVASQTPSGTDGTRFSPAFDYNTPPSLSVCLCVSVFLRGKRASRH